MGIKGFKKLIDENVEKICTASQSIRGKLVIDGYSVLHELYEGHRLDWANGGCYAKQHRATVEYYDALIKAGIEPIVILDGGGCKEHLTDTMMRRKKEISDIPKQLEQHHEGHTESRGIPHLMPTLARDVYLNSLKENKIEVFFSDGKATRTIVEIANYYDCPVLTNSSNYCVCDVSAGVIFFKYLKIDTCSAVIYKQAKFVEFCGMSSNSDLLLAVVAIMGDGTIPFQYHGRVKGEIENSIRGIRGTPTSQILNIANFFKSKRIRSFEDFAYKLEGRTLNFGRQSQALRDNCRQVRKYQHLRTLSIEDLKTSTTMKCSKPHTELPLQVLQSYREGTLPLLAINAITLGQCTLEQHVGDQKQPPPPMLGCPVRQLMYGLVSNLMNEGGCSMIKEYHRNSHGELSYETHVVVPSISSQQELFTTNMLEFGDSHHRILAKQAICDVLKCPMSILEKLKDESDQSLAIVTLVTCYWAKCLTGKESLPYPEQLIRAVTLNFFLDLSGPGEHRSSEIDVSRFTNSLWIKVYHAVLEWQSLYRNVCSLNDMLCQPFSQRSSCFLFDGPLVIFLALHESPDIFEFYEKKLDERKKEQYSKVYAIISEIIGQ